MGNDYNLRPLWDAILDVYKAFAEVCDRNGLRYYATGGTALGAMRHGGFIPWDDDFDLVMPRPDYILFFEKYYKELPPQYVGTDFRTSTDSEMFGKVHEIREDVIERVSHDSNLQLSQGIFIDIIPIDGLPKKQLPFLRWIWGRMTWRKWGCFQSLPLYLRPFWWISAKLLNAPDNRQECKLAFERWLCKWNYDSSDAVDDYNTNPRRLKHRVLTKETFGTPRMVTFENIMIPVPNEVELFLTEIYGDWKSLPPEEKRVPSHQIIRK